MAVMDFPPDSWALSCGRGRRDCGGEVRQYAQLCVRDIALRKVVRAADERSGLGRHRDLHLGIDQGVSRLPAGMVRGRHRIPVIVESGRRTMILGENFCTGARRAADAALMELRNAER